MRPVCRSAAFITAIGEESTKNIGSTARLTSRLLGEEGTTTVITYLTPDRQEQQLSLVHSNYKTPHHLNKPADCRHLRLSAHRRLYHRHRQRV